MCGEVRRVALYVQGYVAGCVCVCGYEALLSSTVLMFHSGIMKPVALAHLQTLVSSTSGILAAVGTTTQTKAESKG